MQTYSIIIPVYNRPHEVEELLSSLLLQSYTNFDVIVVEDGSTISCADVVAKYSSSLKIQYSVINNSGPGPARNHGAGLSSSDYLIILDSDCLLPVDYMKNVNDSIERYHVDAFGGPDRAHDSFTDLQKAINYAMTSFFTTGGIRGGKTQLDKFYPRSFNMGVRREVYVALGGFSAMRYGEDIDFSTRIFKGGYQCRLFPDAWVYHKRRSTLQQFFKQVRHSGQARIALRDRHAGSMKVVHCLPAVFTVGLGALVVAACFVPWVLLLVVLYVLIIFIDSYAKTRSFKVATLSIAASFVQLIGYGSGFLSALFSK